MFISGKITNNAKKNTENMKNYNRYRQKQVV